MDGAKRLICRLSALGVDIARGGKDQTVIAKRYGPWFPRLKKYPGVQTPDGPSVAALVVIEHEGEASINMDIIGVGGSGYDHVKAGQAQVYGAHEWRGEIDRA